MTEKTATEIWQMTIAELAHVVMLQILLLPPEKRSEQVDHFCSVLRGEIEEFSNTH